MRQINWDSVEVSKDFERLPMGGYVMKIVSVEDNPAREFLKLELDIAEGQYTNYYMSGGWYMNAWVSYKESALGMFKAFFMKVEESNEGYKFNNDERTLIGKKIGAVLYHEEYENNQGEVRVAVKPKNWKTADEIRQGKFKMPEMKKLEPVVKEEPAPAVDDSEIPF